MGEIVYFGFRQDFAGVAAAASKYFERCSGEYWAARAQTDGSALGFHLFSEVGIELPGFGGCKAVARAYEGNAIRMLEGPGLEQRINYAKEVYRSNVITLAIVGNRISLKASPADNMKGGEELNIMTWQTSDSYFAKFVGGLWAAEQGIVYSVVFDINSQKSVGRERRDIAYMIMGNAAPVPREGVPQQERVVYRPIVSHIAKPLMIRDGEASDFVKLLLGSGTVQETDEDGSKIGEPYDPHDVGSEDPVCRDAKPAAAALTREKPVPTEFCEDGGPIAWKDDSTANACGVDMSKFEANNDGL